MENELVRIAEINAEVNKLRNGLITIAGPNRCGVANDHVEVYSPTGRYLSQRANSDYTIFYREDFGNPPVKYDQVWGVAKRLAHGLSRDQAISLAMKFAKKKNIFAFLSDEKPDFSGVIYHPEGQRLINLSPGEKLKADYGLLTK